MMSIVLTVLATASRWLTKPRNLALVGVGFLALALAAQTWRASHLKKELLATRERLVDPTTHYTWESEYKVTKQALERQNAAVAAMKAEGDRRAADLAAAVQRASAASRTASQSAARIMAVKPKGDLCARMMAVEAAISREYQ